VIDTGSNMDDLVMPATGRVCDGDAAWRFGYEVLGPVFSEYLFSLDLHIACVTAGGDSRVLFVSRAGVRIRQLYRAWLAAQGRAEPNGSEYFFISRIACMKGTWRSDPGGFVALLGREFAGSPMRDAVAALYGDQRRDGSIDLGHSALEGGMDGFAAFLWGGSQPAEALRWHLDQQSSRYDRYVDSVLGPVRTAVLVDSGWQGTSQRILADWRPDISWWGLYFGRLGQEATDRRHWDRVVGLYLERDGFDPAHPRSAIGLHRHLVESVLEPRAASIESYVDNEHGEAIPFGAEALLADDPSRDDAPLFDGIRAWVGNAERPPRPSDVLRAGVPAETRLARALAFPNRDDVAALALPPRSADMGRTFAVPVMHPPHARFEEDNAEARIAEALWTQGAIVAEYPAELSHKRLALTFDRPLVPGAIGYEPLPFPHAKADAAAVAVITRTLDRPLFLDRALRSVAAQDFHDYVHVVVCDGGDIEEVRNVIEASGADLRRIILVDNVRNRGMEAASNIAIGQSRSDFIVIHDDDDTWAPGFLSAAVAYLRDRRNQGYGGVITGTWYISEEVTPGGIVVHGRHPYNDWIEQVPLTEMACNNMFAPIAFMYRRSVYDALGGYDESFPVLGDWDFNLRFLLASDIGVIRDKLANYHHRDVGNVRLYGNSVYEQRAKHAEYHAILRNKYIRMQSGQFSGLAGPLIAASSIYGELRSGVLQILHALERNGHGPAGGGTMMLEASADERWVMLTRLMTDYASGGQSGGGALVVPAPPDFDENAYLQENPDVAAAIARGEQFTAFGHYFAYGRPEGRRRPRRN